MTNETTASQPKSIGDDEQFKSLMEEVWREMETSVRSDSRDAWNDLVAYIDSRAPAAQASATIQAAPDKWHWCPECGSDEIHYEEGKHKQCALCHQEWFADIDYSDVVRQYLAERKSLLAATTQEPVMIAEPVENQWRKLAMQFDGQRMTALAHLRAMLSDPVKHASIATEFLSAAPMVADPAGVALEAAQYALKRASSLFACGFNVAHARSCTNGVDESGASAEDYAAAADDIRSAISKARDLVRTALAATVKAVPSEALDDAQRERIRDGLSIALGQAMDCTRVWSAWGVGTMSEDDFQLLADNDERLDELVDAVAANLAAPLADKTDGAA